MNLSCLLKGLVSHLAYLLSFRELFVPANMRHPEGAGPDTGLSKSLSQL